MSKRQVRLLEVTFKPFHDHALWPIYQYVEGVFDREDHLDPLDVLVSMPAGLLKPIGPGRTTFINPDDHLELTTAGLIACPSAAEVVRAYFVTMRYFVDQHWELDPRTRPFDADSVVLPSEAVRGQLQAEGLDSSGLVLRRLNSILSAERLSWGYSTGGPEDYTFTLQARIRQWRSIRSPGQYVRALAALEPEPQPPPPLYPSPLSLPAAVDFLDSEWQLNVRMRHLFHDLRALTAAKLALPCTSLEEFESRVSAVYDVLSSIKVPETDEVKARRARGETVGPLERLRLYLNTHLDDAGAGRVEAAINTLKAVVDVRSGSQHAGASRRLPRGYRALGLRYPPASWGSAWEHVQGRTVEALEAIREEIQQIRRRA